MKYFLTIIFQIAFFSMSYSQQIFGEDSLCNGSVRTYWIDLQANMTQVLWLPPNGGSIFEWSSNNDSIQMQWNSNQDRILRVKVFYNDGSSSYENKTIYLFNQPDPKIISNYSGGFAIKMYPNPATDELNIAWLNLESENKRIKIYNLYGQEVL